MTCAVVLGCSVCHIDIININKKGREVEGELQGGNVGGKCQ